MSEDIVLESWFLHEKLVSSLLAERDAANLRRQIPPRKDPFAGTTRLELFERALATYLANSDVASVEVQRLRGQMKEGQLVWLEQAIYFKGLSVASNAVRCGRDGRASFSARLATDKNIMVCGTYNAARVTTSTAMGQLSGRKRQFILGYVQLVTASRIQLRPVVIAQRVFRPRPEIEPSDPYDPAHLWPSAVDQFAAVNFNQRLTKADLDVLKYLREVEIKAAFADILGEPEVPNDWGGEQFDLWTTLITIGGQPLRTAIAFKGPAKFRPMRISDLGQNGDQIDRLSQTPADLMIVQHCHSITAPVVNMLKAYASNPRNPKRYMTIDGYDTVRILRHFKIHKMS